MKNNVNVPVSKLYFAKAQFKLLKISLSEKANTIALSSFFLNSEDPTKVVTLFGLFTVAWFYTVLSKTVLRNLPIKNNSKLFLTRKEHLKLLFVFLLPHLVVQILVMPCIQSPSAHLLIGIATQIIIVVPTFYVLRTLGMWTPIIASVNAYVEESFSKQFNSYGTQLMFWQAAVGLLYPSIFVVYLLCLRFLTVGQSLDMLIFSEINCRIMPLIALVSSFQPVFYWLLTKYAHLRNFLWDNWVASMEATNYYLIQQPTYFKIMLALHKWAFVLNQFIYYHSITKTNGLIKKISYVSWVVTSKMWVIYLVLISSIALEIWLTKKLHFGLYSLLCFIVLKNIGYCIANLPQCGWTHTISLSDYLAQNYVKPHIPHEFWRDYNINNVDQYFTSLEFAWTYSEETKKLLRLAYFEYLENYKKFTFSQKTKQRQITRLNTFCQHSFIRSTAQLYRVTTGMRYNYVHKRFNYTAAAEAERAATSAVNALTRKHVLHPGVGYCLPLPIPQNDILNDSWT
jgi:hypothetical protein